MAFFNDAATDSQGFGMYGDACIMICFRGTESLRDYSTNTRAAKARHWFQQHSISTTFRLWPLTYTLCGNSACLPADSALP
jgi:hypothetical protein